ncbi:MAG: hypothetical protein WAO83_11180, partial [Fuerstiella sp.]
SSVEHGCLPDSRDTFLRANRVADAARANDKFHRPITDFRDPRSGQSIKFPRENQSHSQPGSELC